MLRAAPSRRWRRLFVLWLGGCIAAAAQAGVVLDTRFETDDAWTWQSYAVGGAIASVNTQSAGTVDSRGGSAGKALGLHVDASTTGGYWAAAAHTAWLPKPAGDADLSRLSIAFDLWTSSAHAVRLVVKGYDANNQLTGTLDGIVVSPIGTAYHRHAVDLNTLRKVDGQFDGNSRYVQLFFEISNDARLGPNAWSRSADNALRIDNLALSEPSYYVRENGGSDQFNGRSPTQAFATIQHALDQAQAGDTVMVMGGTYANTYTGADVASLDKAGTPSRWIVLRNYPGHTPLLTTSAQRPAWNGLRLQPSAAYVEIRGLHLRGNNYSPAITLAEAEADSLRVDGVTYFGNPLYNGNGVIVSGSRSGGVTAARQHHIRIIGNTVNAWGGGGISTLESDDITVAHNRSYDNAWYSAYACSGFSVLHAWNFSNADTYRYFILGNTAHGNRSLVTWAATNPRRLSDGNGFIVDDFHNSQASSSIQGHAYNGRLLAQNNVSFNNGGGGIQVFKSSKADIVNNTTFRNGTVLDGYGEIFANQANNVRFVHNILWARPQRPLNSSNGSGLRFERNRYFGDGGNAYTLGTADSYGDPGFVRASIDYAVADFRPAARSVVINAGDATLAAVPPTDHDDVRRPHSGGIDLGAFESVDPIFASGFAP